MKIDGWKYYNHAAVPTTPPHIEPDITSINDETIWNLDGNPLLARWTTDFDCLNETNWWYCIKDTPFDISSLKAKRRYEINKGRKNFIIKEIKPVDYVDEIYEIEVAAYALYPKKYRPNVDKDKLAKRIQQWNHRTLYGAFCNSDVDKLVGFAILDRKDDYISYSVQKVLSEYESLGINAAIVSYVLDEHKDFLCQGGYICDGARNIQHETAFQDYLEKYFGFRKAYCNLRIAYKPKMKLLIKMIYPFRKIMKKLDGISIVHKMNGVILMESIARGDYKNA